MKLEQFCSASRVVIVAGKGGVGKTTVTAALAQTAARAGLSVLIVEVEGKSWLATLFDRPALGYEETLLAPGIRGRTLSPDQALVEYLDDHGMRPISKRLRSTGALEVVAASVPGMKDILVLGKVKQLEQARAADLIVVDAPAAGHAITFLTSAVGLLDAMATGPIAKQAADVAALLTDPARCRVSLVTLPEETPVAEVVETAFALEDRAGVTLGPVVVNGMWPPPVPCTPRLFRAGARAAGITVTADDLAVAERSIGFAAARRERQDVQVRRLADLLPLAQIPLPFRFGATLGPADLEALTDAFVEGIVALAPDVV